MSGMDSAANGWMKVNLIFVHTPTFYMQGQVQGFTTFIPFFIQKMYLRAIGQKKKPAASSCSEAHILEHSAGAPQCGHLMLIPHGTT
jgi:hypothetical protein